MVNKTVSVDDLSLSLGTSDAPFALVGLEKYLKSDDWAWQFLRLNGSYQRDYAAALAENNPDDNCPKGSFWITDRHLERKVRAKELHCRNRYGLSTWLDPQCSRLPKLNPGESWFFPLRQTVDSPVDLGGAAPMEGVFSYDFVWPDHGAGDSRRGCQRICCRNTQEDHSKIWFAIDCSVPAAGQMTAVELLVRLRRDRFLRDKQRSHTGSSAVPDVVPLSECQQFRAEKFTKASAVLRSDDAGRVWHAVCVDVLGPLKKQLDDLLVVLNKKYQMIYEKGIASEPILKRFRPEIIGPRDVGGDILTDGNYLKALVICAQLSQKGKEPNEIVEFISSNAVPSAKEITKDNGVRDEWVSGLGKRIINYREQARAFVKGGYRWLIHAQKP